MMKGDTPCLRCEDRHLGCHSECERYKDMIAERQAIKDAVKANDGSRLAKEFLSDSIAKTQRKHRLTKRK